MHENRETSSAPVEQTGRSEKALCCTADMYALEESDRCVVPMKQLNKEGNLRRKLWREGGDPRRTLHYLARVRLRAGNLCHRGRAECADSSTPLSKGRAFLLWESAYAELLFTDRMWPEFDETDFDNALEQFLSRERRFGALPVPGLHAAM